MPKTKGSFTQKYTLDHAVFDLPLTDEAIYWIGFLLGDGGISKKKNRIVIGLQNRDKEHIEKFRKFVKTNKPPYIIKREAYTGGKSYRLAIFSKHIKNVLMSYNVIPKKSMIESPPILLRDNPLFWRGLVDADGTVEDHHKTETKVLKSGKKTYHYHYPRIRINGSVRTCIAFSFYAERITGHRPRPYKSYKSEEGLYLYELSVQGEPAIKIMEHLYKDAPKKIRLERKYQLAMELIDKYKPIYEEKGSKSKLTDDDIKEIIRLYTEENMSYKNIGRIYKRDGYQTIRKILIAYGVETRKPASYLKEFTPEEISDIYMRYNNGESYTKLAREYKRDIRTIRSLLLSKGASIRKPPGHDKPLSNKQIKELISKYKSGSSLRSLSKEYDKSRSYINKLLKDESVEKVL